MKQSEIVSAADHSIDPPVCIEADGAPTWITRGSNFVVAVTKVKAGTRLAADGTTDEHMMLIQDTTVHVGTADLQSEVGPGHLVIVPPGDCHVTSRGEGLVVRFFTSRRLDFLAMASNAADFATPNTHVAPLQDWPAPPSGFATRLYRLDDFLVEDGKTRVFRAANMMVNVLRERPVPRDVEALSPHSHSDFEQCSLSMRGTHIHHLRRPWTPNMKHWAADEALEVGSPSVVVIPPHVVHTTRNIGNDPALLVDFFAPPRFDFSRRPGMVCNAEVYPMPAEASA